MQNRLLYLILSLAVAAPLFGFTLLVDPPAPTTNDVVRVRVSGFWRDSCVPQIAIVDSPRNGEVMIGLRRPPAMACLAVITPFSLEVAVPPLPAGTWTIIVHDATDNLLILRPLIATTIVVSSPPGLVEIEPRVIAAGTSTGWISIRAPQIAHCPPITNPCPIPEVRFNGQRVPEMQVVSENEVLVRAPLGAETRDIDVEIAALDGMVRLENIIRVVGAINSDPALYERVLIPVIYNGPGAHGSLWRTDLALHNSSRAELMLRGRASLGPRETRVITDPQNAPAGLYLDVARGSGDVLHANALVRDLSREAEGLGTELPIVREHDWKREKAVLMNVPGGANYRVTVRAYAFAGAPEAALSLPYAVYAMNGTNAIATGSIRFTSSADGPAYGSFELTQATGGPLRIEFGPLPVFADPRFWVFASITNNNTQQVTIVRPQ